MMHRITLPSPPSSPMGRSEVDDLSWREMAIAELMCQGARRVHGPVQMTVEMPVRIDARAVAEAVEKTFADFGVLDAHQIADLCLRWRGPNEPRDIVCSLEPYVGGLEQDNQPAAAETEN